MSFVGMKQMSEPKATSVSAALSGLTTAGVSAVLFPPTFGPISIIAVLRDMLNTWNLWH